LHLNGTCIIAYGSEVDLLNQGFLLKTLAVTATYFKYMIKNFT